LNNYRKEKIIKSKDKKDISEIEKKVDDLIYKNKSIFEIQKFNPTNKKQIYYLKKKKKDEKSGDLSTKIISKARDNLGEEPLPQNNENKQPEKDKNKKIQIKFGKKKKLDKKIVSFDQNNQNFDQNPQEKNKTFFNPLKKTKNDNEIKNEISPFNKTKETENKFGQKHEENKYPKEQKSFFDKKIDSGINLKNEPEKQEIKPTFKVDNFPKKEIQENEAKIVDEKIKQTSFETQTNTEDKKIEEKAMELAKKHIKDTPETTSSPYPEKKIREDKTESLLTIDNSEEKDEHVFFDEPESDNAFSWSPQTPQKEKTKKPPSVPINTEIKLDEEKPNDDIELPKEVLRNKSVKLSDLGFSEQEWEELDFYSLHEPFAYVEILREKDSLDKCYFLVEAELTEEEQEIMNFIDETMSRLSIDTEELDAKGEQVYLAEKLNEILSEYDVNPSEESKNKIFYYLGKDSLGLGKLDPLLKDPNIEDISCDGSNVPLFLYHRKYGSLKSNINFSSEDELSSFIFKLAQKCGKHISIAEPMLDATMPDGSRVQMTLSDEITAKGSTFTIRKFREDPFSPPDLVEFNTMSPEMIAYLWLAIENGVNTLFAGGTASGKTTAMNAVSLFIPRESKIVSIEETREINLPHPNWIPGVARAGFGEVVADKVVGEIDMYDLMKAALRQRPEYILVGEIRGREAYVLFQAMATGHATYSTVHADSAQSLIHRLEGKPINIPRVMLQSLDIVCLHVITRVKNKRARRCKQIIEIIDIDPTTKEILTNEVFRWDPVEDKFVYSGKSYILEKVRAEKDLSREKMTDEIKNRKKIVEWMNKHNIREFRDVAKLIAQYSDNPKELIKSVLKEVNN